MNAAPKKERDYIEILKSPMTNEDWEKFVNAIEVFARIYIRYRCVEIASKMNVHGNAQETVDRAGKFMDYILEEGDYE